VTVPRAPRLLRLALCAGLVACGGGGGGGAGGTTGMAGVTGMAGATGGAGGGAAGTGFPGTGTAGATSAGGTGGNGGVATGGTGGGGSTGSDAATSMDASDAGASDLAAIEARPDAPAAAGCMATGATCWDFEEGHLPTGWTPYRSEFSGTLLVDGTKPHRGKFALHAMDLMGNVEGKDGGPKKTMRFNLPTTPPYFGPTLWGRAFVFTTPARPMSHAGLFNARYPRPGAAMNTWTNIATLDWYEVATSTMNYVSIFHPPEPPGTPEWVQTSDTPLVLDNWACVEWLFDAANGGAAEAAEPRVWVDGTEIVWSKTFVSPTTAMRPTHEKATTFTVLEVGIYLYQGLSTATNWWIDDLGVSPQRIGCN
jgi:hypothetical protein